MKRKGASAGSRFQGFLRGGMGVGLVTAITALACTRGSAPSPAPTSDPGASSVSAVSAAHAWSVYDGQTLVLEVSDMPGPILSTAALPPGAAPRQHPFLSATAKSARHEDDLHRRLTAAASLSDFLDALRAGGYAVVAKPTAGGAPRGP